MIRIAFCYITPFHPNKGGIGRVTDALTRELQRRGHEVYYLIFESGMTIKHEYDYPAPLYYLPSKELLSTENLEFYHKFLLDHKIDIVIDQGGNFAEFPLWLNVGKSCAKRISVIHTYDTVTYRHLWNESVIPLRGNSINDHLKRLARIILYPKTKGNFRQRMINSYRSMTDTTDHIVALSENFLPELTAICPGIENKISFIGNPVPYAIKPENNHTTQKEKIILFVGLFGSAKQEDKAALIWKRIAGKYPDWTFCIIGYGDEKRTKRLKQIASGINNFKLLGYQDPHIYQQRAAIACMTSSHEGWPLVLMEAMQCGAVPILYDSFASASEIIQPGKTGELVTPFDEKEYIHKLYNLIENDNYREQLSEAAKESAKKYSVESIADKWEALFTKLLG